MCGGSTHGPVPPLARSQVGAVDFKFSALRHPRRCRLQSTDVASMAELGLRIATNDVVIEDLRHPVRLLLL